MNWQKRLKKYKTPATNGVTALCLEIHDLWISEALANRQKDIEFCKALISHELVKPKTLEQRLQQVDEEHAKKVLKVKALINTLS